MLKFDNSSVIIVKRYFYYKIHFLTGLFGDFQQTPSDNISNK